LGEGKYISTKTVTLMASNLLTNAEV